MLALTSGLAAAVLREGLRHHVPRHSPLARGRARPRGARVDADRHGRSWRSRAWAWAWRPSPSCQALGSSSLATRGWRQRPRVRAGLSLSMPGAVGQMSPPWLRWRLVVATAGVVARRPPVRERTGTPRGRHLGLRPDRPDARGWSTRRPHSPSPCAACSPSSTGRPRTSRSTSTRSRRYFVQSIEYRSEIAPLVRAAPLRAGVARLSRRPPSYARAPGRARSTSTYLVYMMLALLRPAPAGARRSRPRWWR